MASLDDLNQKGALYKVNDLILQEKNERVNTLRASRDEIERERI
jgi:hypothetical protein